MGILVSELQFTDYLFDWETYRIDKDSALAHLDLLTTTLTGGDSLVFFANPASYPISGVFVKYLIDKIGLSGFKDIYSGNQIELDLKARYGYTVEQLIREFKSALKN